MRRITTKRKPLFFKFLASTLSRMSEINEFLREPWYICTLQSQSWKYTVKNENSELLENPTSTVSQIFNTLVGIFGDNIFNKNWHFSDLILLVYDYRGTSSQNCSLKYRFRALENVSRGMPGPRTSMAAVAALSVRNLLHDGAAVTPTAAQVRQRGHPRMAVHVGSNAAK